jgi:hypothetical protein
MKRKRERASEIEDSDIAVYDTTKESAHSYINSLNIYLHMNALNVCYMKKLKDTSAFVKSTTASSNLPN